MKHIDKIIEAFEGEKEVVVICSSSLVTKLNKELTDGIDPDGGEGVSVNYRKPSLGFTSVSRKGVVVHYTSDLKKIMNGS